MDNAGLGRKENAVREGKKAVELLPVSQDPWRGPYRVADLARIYVMVGEYDAAIDQLEYLLSIPGEISIPLLWLDPTWDPLRDNPRFHKMLKQVKQLGNFRQNCWNGWNDKAIEHYEKFLDLWKEADLGIPEVEDAKKRLVGLKSM